MHFPAGLPAQPSSVGLRCTEAGAEVGLRTWHAIFLHCSFQLADSPSRQHSLAAGTLLQTYSCNLTYTTDEKLVFWLQPGRVTDNILNLQGRTSEPKAARIMCMYISADWSTARLAILHGSQLTILSVRGIQSIVSHSSASIASAASISANAGAEMEYADITAAIQPSQPMSTQAEKMKRRQLRRLQIFVACGGPPAVLPDQLR